MTQSLARRGARIIFALIIFAVLVLAITSRADKRMTDFDQSFYLTIAYDLDRHGVFSNGIFDDVDSTSAAPPPGMFFAPLYPSLVLAAMKMDSRFAAALTCAIEANEKKRKLETCEIYARPMHVVHAALLALGVVAIAAAAELLFASQPVFFLAGALATAGLIPEAELFSYLMTESLAFSLFSLAALAFLAGLKTSRAVYHGFAGLLLGLLCLTRPSFVVLAPAMAILVFVKAGWISGGDRKPVGVPVIVFALCFTLVVGPWVARNYLSVGKLGLTEEYGSATLVERLAFDQMTSREFALAFPYCIPEIGPPAVARLFGADAMARFQWNQRGSFFEIGRAHRVALTEGNQRLDRVIGSVIRAEMAENWWRYILSIIPLAWCGLWVGSMWSLVMIPLFAAACIQALRRTHALLLLYAAPAVLMVGLHAAVANHYSRYNLPLIGPLAAGGARVTSLAASSLWSRRRKLRRA